MSDLPRGPLLVEYAVMIVLGLLIFAFVASRTYKNQLLAWVLFFFLPLIVVWILFAMDYDAQTYGVALFMLFVVLTILVVNRLNGKVYQHGVRF